jgi:RNA polymerase sigma-70 factor (ECF subfamily)
MRSIFSVFTQEQVEDQSGEEEQVSDQVEKKEFRERLARFMSRLSSSEKEVFHLRYVDELSIREIASILGRNESTVKTHLYRGVEKFRREKGLEGFLKEDKP